VDAARLNTITAVRIHGYSNIGLDSIFFHQADLNSEFPFNNAGLMQSDHDFLATEIVLPPL
jgi:hypothetical protein